MKDRCPCIVRSWPGANPGVPVQDSRWALSFRVIREPTVIEETPTVAVTAYILIQAEVGAAADVADATRELEQVITADVAMGPYDVIARASAADMDELGGVVVNSIGKIQGVERTLLCPIVNL